MNETRVVPVEATPEMLRDGYMAITQAIEDGPSDMPNVWAAMLSAAPPTADAQGDGVRTPKCWACDGVGQCQVCAPTTTVDDTDAVRWRKLCSAIDQRDPWIRAVVDFHGPRNLDSVGLTALIDVPESEAISHAHPQEVPGE